jgi:hypothetical protein
MFKQPISSSQGLFGMSVGMRLAIVAVVIAAVAVPLITVGNTVSDLTIPSLAPVVAQGISTPTAPATTPTPVSYLTAAGVRAGLGRVAKLLPGARLALVRLDARSLSASAHLRNGTFKEIALTPTGSVETTGASTGQRPIPISQISPRAVARIVTGMKRSFHVAPARLDYMVLSSPRGAPTQWVIFSKAPGSPGFTATLSGGRLARLPK